MASSDSQTPTTAGSTVAPSSAPSRRRPEIQGLRAFAVLLVVVYHIFTDRVSGGVDVFLFISAFFLTLSFSRVMESGQQLQVTAYWIKVFQRLVPMAALIVLVTYLTMWLFYPAAEAAMWRPDGVASMLYVENWLLASRAVDYYATDGSTMSPFQHFWSLSVQGQVFLLWPILFLLGGAVAKRLRKSPVAVLSGLFGVVFAASLLWSVHETRTNQTFAYFDTSARLWEFALASLVALFASRVNLAPKVSLVLGWVGLIGLLAVGIIVDVQGAFPGWIALWPLLAAAAIMVAGPSESRYGVDRLLSWRPLVRLGDSAYALYLVHWPLIITILVATGQPKLEFFTGVVVILVSGLLAVVLTKFFDRPVTDWGRSIAPIRRGIATVIVAVVAVIAVSATWSGIDKYRLAQTMAEADRNNPGAEALAGGYVDRTDPDAPALPVISGDYPLPEYEQKCPNDLVLRERVSEICNVLVKNDDAKTRVLMVGNSHVMQWSPAVRQFGKVNDFEVVSFVVGNCILGTEEEQIVPHMVCKDFLEEVPNVVARIDPDLIILQDTRSGLDGEENQSKGMRDWMNRFTREGRHVLAIRDNPRFKDAPHQCVQRLGSEAEECILPYEMPDHADSPFGDVSAGNRGITELDMNDLICPDGRCNPVIGNVYTYWDPGHLSPTYVESMGRAFSERAIRALTKDGFSPEK